MHAATEYLGAPSSQRGGPSGCSAVAQQDHAGYHRARRSVQVHHSLRDGPHGFLGFDYPFNSLGAERPTELAIAFAATVQASASLSALDMVLAFVPALRAMVGTSPACKLDADSDSPPFSPDAADEIRRRLSYVAGHHEQDRPTDSAEQ